MSVDVQSLLSLSSARAALLHFHQDDDDEQLATVL